MLIIIKYLNVCPDAASTSQGRRFSALLARTKKVYTLKFYFALRTHVPSGKIPQIITNFYNYERTN